MKTKQLKKFDPVALFGTEWSIESNVKTPTHFNFSQIHAKSYLVGEECWLSGNQVLERQIAAGDTPLSADVAQYFKDNPSEYPEEWKGKAVFFDGTILRGPDGHRCTVYAFWDVNSGTVKLYYDWLDINRNAIHPSALLASSEMLETDTLSSGLRLKKLEEFEKEVRAALEKLNA